MRKWFLNRIFKHLRAFPTNAPRGFHVETTWKRLLPRRFNVESTWCVFTVYNHLRTFKNCFSIRNALNCHSITLLPLACAITTCAIFGKSRQASASMVVSVFISCMTICKMKKFKTIFSFRDIRSKFRTESRI